MLLLKDPNNQSAVHALSESKSQRMTLRVIRWHPVDRRSLVGRRACTCRYVRGVEDRNDGRIEAPEVKSSPCSMTRFRMRGGREKEKCDHETRFCISVSGLPPRIHAWFCTRRLNARCWHWPWIWSWRLWAQSDYSVWGASAAGARGEPDTGSAPATSAGTHHQWAVLQRELPVVRQLLRNWRRLPAPSDCRSRAPGSRLPFDFNDVPPYRLLSLLALRRQRRGDLDRSLPLRNLPKVRGARWNGEHGPHFPAPVLQWLG
jgi:hypothetical protein